MKISSILFVYSLIFLLTSCSDETKDIGKLCKNNSELQCDKTNMRDGQCQATRTAFILKRLETSKKKNETNLIEEYKSADAYDKCLDLATQIEPINGNTVKNKRLKALFFIKEYKKELISQFKKSDSPYVLHLLWEQGDKEARRQFLKLEGSEKLRTAEMQFVLAEYYSTRDNEKTLTFLHRALRLSDPLNINKSILASLVTKNREIGNKEHSYIWLLVGKHYGMPIASKSIIRSLYPFDSEKKELLQKSIELIITSIDEKTFTPTLLPEMNR